MNTVINIGIDVHKDSYSLCAYALGNSQAFGQMRIESRDELVVKYVDRQSQGIPCVLMAPTSLPKAPGRRVKNDRLDAELLAKHLHTAPTAQ